MQPVSRICVESLELWCGSYVYVAAVKMLACLNHGHKLIDWKSPFGSVSERKLLSNLQGNTQALTVGRSVTVVKLKGQATKFVPNQRSRVKISNPQSQISELLSPSHRSKIEKRHLAKFQRVKT